MLAQFEISKGKKTPNCSRPIRSKTGDNKGKESKTNRSVEIRMFTILDLLLLHKSWVFNLVLVPTDGTHSLISKENDGLESSIRFKETEASTWRGDDPTKKHKQRGGAQEQGDQQGQAEGRGNGRKEKHAQEHEQE